MASSIGQVLYLATRHGWLPGSSCDVDVEDAHTRKSFRFFGRRKAIKGGVGNALRNHSEIPYFYLKSTIILLDSATIKK